MLSLITEISTLTSLAQLYGQVEAQSISSHDWAALSHEVGGRLFPGSPFAEPCFSGNFTSPACTAVQNDYLNETTRSGHPGAYIETQWETCQASGDQCLLDFIDPHNPQPTVSPHQCKNGSIPDFFIDVRQASDVQAAFKFVKNHNIPLVIKNTGHDYKGRSSAPGSLGLWTHNLQDMKYAPSFVPAGCKVAPQQAITVGAGVQWREAYEFADLHNVTIVGGADISVGVSGGWLQGGGHGALSPSMGMGVDRVLQFKVVTPDGTLRVANQCQNQDLFFALRGGGGGTFGVVLESTTLASPRVTLQTLILTFAANTTNTRRMWSIMAENALRWGEEGWGGYSKSNALVLLNPKLSQADAQTSLAPLLDFGKQLQSEDSTTILDFTEFPSWYAFFQIFAGRFLVPLGTNLALASRLVPKDSFATAQTQETLVSALLAVGAKANLDVLILITAPAAFPFVNGTTSVTEAWRSSLYHVVVPALWNWNATLAEKRSQYDAVSQSIDNLRKITPDAAYQNEADVHEPNHEVSFWGDNYPKLLQIKQKYDPHHLLDCWQCVGWNRNDPRFACYI